jgi:hypothetical protein
VDRQRLIDALSGLLGAELAHDLVDDFLKIRRDASTKTLERASLGRFVETFVQCLQYMSDGNFDAKPDVDIYLNSKAENAALPEGLRICAARIARSMYTLRNKRNIAHKNEVDSNTYDLAFIHQSAAWITAELLRNATSISMQEAGALIDLIQTPVGTLVEELDGVRLVHAEVSTRQELLILLHSHYPEVVQVKDILQSLSRRPQVTVRNRLRELYAEKLLQGDNVSGYRLTRAGYDAALAEISNLRV